MFAVNITAKPIQADALLRSLQPGEGRSEPDRLQQAATGALVTFSGHVRGAGIRAMSLEHYPGMTEQSIYEQIARASERWSVLDAVVEHRVGELVPGDLIVWVGVSASHRADAFAACEYIMDFLKVEAPLWKREQALDGQWQWVDAKTSDTDRAERWLNLANS